MKNKIISAAFLIASLCCINTAFSQTGIYYYDSPGKYYPNKRIIDIKESSDGNIYLLGIATDSVNENPQPYFAIIDNKFKMISGKVIETGSLYELKNMIILPNGKIKIYGTESAEGGFKPYTKTINTKGDPATEEVTMTFNSTLICNAEQVDKFNALICQTVRGNSKKYNISVYQIDLIRLFQVWYKKMQSESNEEASQLFISDSNIIIPAKKYNDDFTSFTSVIYKLNSKHEIIWQKEIKDAESNFTNQAVSADKRGNIIYLCSKQNNEIAKWNTKLIKLSPAGEVISVKSLDSISAKGILRIANGNYLIYGSNYNYVGVNLISKAKIIILNNSFEKIYEREMSFFDPPDAELPSLAMTAMPSSSDILTAEILSDGRIICGGRVYMPRDKEPDKIIISPRFNNPFVIVLDKDGKLH
ncbi:MAG: hypothetical protein PHD97_11010 [Bacteroidales bacterium]|nr:hypothetical protein [Bacteroidales bacterium]